MTPCPKCQKPVDPLRARAVGVRDGKILAYCSAGCADTDLGAPTKAGERPGSKRSRTPTSAATKPLSRRRRDSLDAKTAWDWLDDVPAELGAERQVRERSPLLSKLLVAVVLVVVVGGYVAYRLA